MKHGDSAYLLELLALFTNQGTKDQGQSVQCLQKLLSKYKCVFQLPNELPPPQNREHSITLQPDVVLLT